MARRMTAYLFVVLSISCFYLAGRASGHADPQLGGPVVDRRRQLQQQNLEALSRLRSLLSDQLSQSPATLTPYPQQAAGRRRRLRAAKPFYATQCLYEPPPAEASDDDVQLPRTLPAVPPDGSALTAADAGGSTPSGTAAERRRRLTQDSDSSGDAAPPPPPTGTCYLNPAALASPDMPDPETPIETMLLKSAWTAYQCSFENRKGRCGTYRHEPYDCRWQAEQGRCAVPPDYLLPRLLTYLHCRDDAALTPFWDRCYRVGVLLTGGDNDWCGQSDGNLARCWWFPARSEQESDTCGPSPAGGVASRDAYDELVASMRNGTWQREWFGECPTAEVVYTIKAACNYTTAEDCAADPSCSLQPDMPIEYGMCRLADDKIWEALFGTESALFNATAAAMAECAAASNSLEECMAAGSLTRGSDGGGVELDADKFGDVIDLVFIEEVTPGSAGPTARASPAVALLCAAAALLAAALARPSALGWL